MASMSSRQHSEFTAAVVRHLPCDRISAEVAQRYIDSPAELAALLECTFVEAQAGIVVPRPTIDHRFRLTLDYSVSPADALRATECNYIYPWMLEHCPAWKGTDKVEVEVCLIYMCSDYESDEAETAITELALSK